ncbi:DUF397 domain-containing protein [Streptomyces sp. NPDC096310]|uniref:DUF397 domain-containing protein n=1 Tax=Streptomyces sp. NPDC096310 TaxID=3366082 RepID=UPI00382663BE
MDGIDLAEVVWIKSSHSNGQSACVEAALDSTDVVPVRDSKAVRGPILLFATTPWSAFVADLKQGPSWGGM